MKLGGGGSDRNFLQLTQNLNEAFSSGNLTVYVDSSVGELKNRQPIELSTENGVARVAHGPGDAADPLQLNVAFLGGYEQYCETFAKAATRRQSKKAIINS